METIEKYKLMSTNELVEIDRRLTEVYWRIANEITIDYGYDVFEKSTDLLEAINEQIKTVEGLMVMRNDLLEWPQPIIELYHKRQELIIYNRS